MHTDQTRYLHSLRLVFGSSSLRVAATGCTCIDINFTCKKSKNSQSVVQTYDASTPSAIRGEISADKWEEQLKKMNMTPGDMLQKSMRIMRDPIVAKVCFVMRLQDTDAVISCC